MKFIATIILWFCLAFIAMLLMVRCAQEVSAAEPEPTKSTRLCPDNRGDTIWERCGAMTLNPFLWVTAGAIEVFEFLEPEDRS